MVSVSGVPSAAGAANAVTAKAMVVIARSLEKYILVFFYSRVKTAASLKML
jgi:hypothetical protein